MKEYLTKEQTDKLFNIITANGCREMEEDRFNQAVNEAINISRQLESQACFKWQKEKPTKPCVFMTRVWNKRLGIYDYDIWRFEKVDCGDGWYLQWLTKDGAEWGDIKYCNFDEYCIIESKSV